MTRRAALTVLALLAAGMLSGCSSTQRPEGVVERWLLALNQGAAGRPGLYAPDALSERILPGWRTKDPGQLDVIEVGRGTGSHLTLGLSRGPQDSVPYRVVVVDGPTRQGLAVLTQTNGVWRVAGLGPPSSRLRLPSQGGPPLGSSSASLWLGALGVAVVLSLMSVGLMTLVGRKPDPVPTYPVGGASEAPTPPA